MSRIVLGVSGGIAAYKACEVLRRLVEPETAGGTGHEVRVVPTAAALEFVGATTWAALSHQPVTHRVFDHAEAVDHVRLGRQADLVLVAPATTDLLARAAGGRADDLLTNVLLTATCPVLLCPAMHTEMWQHPATRDNVATLRRRGIVVLDPADGRLTGSDSGPGRLPDPAEIVAVARTLLADPELASKASAHDLTGLRVVVSAGGTREPLDPVRFLGNVSSGRMGVALARSAALRGATVRLVAAHLDVPSPSGVEVTTVGTTAELDAAMTAARPDADALVMAAAVADFTPEHRSTDKIGKQGDGGLQLGLTQTTDVLAHLVRLREDDRAAGVDGAAAQVIVGFAAETPTDTDLIAMGRAKLARKGCDLLVLNDVTGGRVFGSSDNAVTVIGTESVDGPHAGSKESLAHLIWDRVATLRSR